MQDRRRQTKAKPEGRGSLVDRWATVEKGGARTHGVADGSTGRGGVWALEAESRETLTMVILQYGSATELAPHR